MKKSRKKSDADHFNTASPRLDMNDQLLGTEPHTFHKNNHHVLIFNFSHIGFILQSAQATAFATASFK